MLINLFFMAYIISSAVFFELVFESRFERCLSTVRLLMNSESAISWFDRPLQMPCSTWCSRFDRVVTSVSVSRFGLNLLMTF